MTPVQRQQSEDEEDVFQLASIACHCSDDNTSQSGTLPATDKLRNTRIKKVTDTFFMSAKLKRSLLFFF